MEKKWYAVFNKDANLIWGYGNTKKQAEKEAQKLYKECKDNNGVATEKIELYKIVEVSKDVIEYMENISDALMGCIRISNYYYESTNKGGKCIDLTYEAKDCLDKFKELQQEKIIFRKEFEAL